MSRSRPDGVAVRGIIVDSSLLVLLAAGTADPAIIQRHKRLRTFRSRDFDRLQEMVARYERVLVTPNTLTEASNLLMQHREPERSRLTLALRTLIRESHEVFVSSPDAAEHPSFSRLGLTDSGLPGLVSKDAPLVTVDIDLYLATAATDPSSAVNYRHLQERSAQLG